MKTPIRAILFAAAMLAYMPSFAASPPASESAFQAAIARSDLNNTVKIFDALVKQRLPTKDTAKPDRLLDKLLVEQMANSGELVVAGAILERMLADPATVDKDHARLLLATVREGTGAFDEASRMYSLVAASPLATTADKFASAIGAARVRMSADPAGAAQMLATVDRAAAQKGQLWEIDLLAARAAAMMGADAASSAALDRAWAEAADAPLAVSAVLRVATDRAAAAARAGDRSKMIALLAVDRGNRSPNRYQSQLSSNLPVCGTDGVRVDDQVVIAVASKAAPARPKVELIWASRQGIARAFLAATAFGAPSVSDGRIAPFGLRCRTAPSLDYVVRNDLDESIVGWMTGLGAYPLVSSDADDDTVSLAGTLANRQARYGENSVMLLPLYLRIAAGMGPEMIGDDDARRRALDNFTRIQAILERNRAPNTMILLSRLMIAGLQVITNTMTEAQGIANVQAIMTDAAKDPNLSPDLLYGMANGLAQSSKLPSGFRDAMVTSALNSLRIHAKSADPRVAALAIRLFTLRSERGDPAGAAQAIAGLHLAPDLCMLADPRPHYISSAIASDDYPGDVVFASIRGSIRLDLALDASGNARDGRLLVSDPAFAFDDITAARISTIRYDPPRFAGHVGACRGELQTIVWQVPD